MLFSFSDRPVQEALRLFREERCMSEPTRGAVAAARLQAAADDLVAEARRLPAELIHWSPGEGVWSVMDNLCHVREFVPFWTGETLRIVRTPARAVGPRPHRHRPVSAVTDTAARAATDVLDDLDAVVRVGGVTLSGLSDADLATEAESSNPRWGQAGVVRRRPAAGRITSTSISARFAATPVTVRRREPAAAPLLFPGAAAGRSCQSVDVRTRVPIRRIFCVGRNYEAHAREMGVAVDRDAPFYFTKSAGTTCRRAPRSRIRPGTGNYHYEMELVVVLGRPAFAICGKTGRSDCVFGYACGLDMTRRDLPAGRARAAPALGSRQGLRSVRRHVDDRARHRVRAPDAAGAIELRVNGEIEAAVRPVAAHPRRTRRRRAPVDLLSPAAG